MSTKISQLSDPRLDPYRELKKTNFTRSSRRFIAEGRLVAQRLLASSFQVESVLVAESKWASMSAHVARAQQILILDDSLVDQLVGFQFHAGVMACGIRNKRKSWDGLLPDTGSPLTLMALPETSLPDNLGSLIRIAAAFGCDAIVVGRRCADPFSRRVIRVSMGNVFAIPLIEPDQFESELRNIQRQLDVEIIATTLDQSAESLTGSERRQKNVCLMFGNESKGLSPEELELADRRLTLPMADGIDSLNVANAAAIFLYHFTRVTAPR